MKKIGLIGLIGLIGFLLGAREARAQSISLSISPPLLEVIIKPGKSITQVYKLTNAGEPVILTLKLYELGDDGLSENPIFVPEKWITLVSNDLAFDKPFLLGKEKTAEFLLRIAPPHGTAEQDYYRALVFATTPNPPADTTMSSFAQNLAAPILISVTSTGALVRAAQISQFVVPTILDSFEPLSATIEVKNTGKAYFRPVGKITLTGPIGRGSYNLIPSAILAGQTKPLFTDHLPPPEQESKTLYLPGFYIGRYQLTLDFTLDESTQRVMQVKTFYAVPWKAGLVLVAVSTMILWKRKRKKT